MMLALVMLSFCLFRLASPCLGNQWLHIYLAPSYIPSQVPPERKLQLDHGAASHLFQTLFFRRHASTRVPNQARMTGPAYSPSNPPEISIMAPTAAPVLSPKYHGSFANPPISKHHRRGHHATSPISLSPPPDCDDIFCSEPLTRTPIGSPCGCVSPMQVVIDVGVAPYLLFTEIAELALEVAAGTFLKQSQVKIMGANASIRGQEKTTVTIYLVPLGEKFDRTTALLIYERFWQKKVPIRKSFFHDYEVIYVHYPGLPSSPPSSSGGSSALGPSASGGHQYPFTANVPSGKSQKLNARIISLVAVSSFIVVLACVVVACIVFKSKKLGHLPADPEPVTLPPATKRSGMKSIIPSSVASSISVSFVSTMVTCPPSVKTFSLAELEKATDGFNTVKILGEGGSGRVYHGTMQDGREVAVKVLTRENQDSDREREFIAEVEMLSRLHHRNLVKLIGVCIEGHKRCLVYELVRNGSVESHLHGVDKRKGLLDWDARMKIALGAARALAYLHEDSNPRVIHRDFKASNVLLEDDFNPKVSDFGLAREASEGTNHISTRVMGTFGYVAPEYAMTGHLLVKSDVYSYGVVLLELLSGRKPVYMSEPQGPENLVTWARPLLTNREGLEQLVDPLLQGNFDFDNMARVAAIASMCVHIEPSQRPFMGEVVQALKLIYKDTDEACEDSYSQRESTSAPDFDMKADYGPESSWWSGGSPCYGRASPFITMDYSSGPMGEIERPHSTSSLVGRGESATACNRSGPLRTKRKKSSFYRLRGSMSEHGYPLRHFPLNGSQDFGL